MEPNQYVANTSKICTTKQPVIFREAKGRATPALYGNMVGKDITYRRISSIRLTISQNLNDSQIVLQSSLTNPLKPGVKSGMKM